MTDLQVRSVEKTEEYIDLVDVVRFLWRSRNYILLGILCGVLFATYINVYKFPPRYYFRIPVSVDTAGAMDLATVKSRFNDLVSTPSVAERIFDELEKNSDPAVMETLKKLNWTRQTFVALQSGSGGGNLTPLRIETGETKGSYVVESTRLSPELGVELARAMTAAVKEVFLDQNRRMKENFVQKSPKEIQNNSAPSRAYVDVAKSLEIEKSPARMRLFAIEDRLVKKWGPSIHLSKVVRTGERDQIERLLAALVNAGKVRMSEAVQILEERAELIGIMNMVDAKYSQALKDAKEPLNLTVLQIRDATGGNLGLLPIVEVDEPLLQERIQSGTVQNYESKSSYFYSVGVILGGVLGMVVFGMNLFVSQNRDRLRDVFRTKAGV